MRQKTSTGTRPAERVVVLGAGFGGYFAARKLGRILSDQEAHVTVISDTDGFVYQPLLPEVAVGAVDPRSVVVPLSKLRRIHLLRGHATAVDLETQAVVMANMSGTSRRVRFDRLVLALGGVTRRFDIPGLDEHALGFKTVTQALYLRDLVLQRMERANDEPDFESRRKLLTFIVVGAGYAGTELVAQMSRMTARLAPQFPGLSGPDVRWMLLDMASAVMPELGGTLGDRALTVLRERGVDVRFGTSITEITSRGATLTDGTRVDGATVVWCAGVAPNPLIAATGLATSRGRLMVDADFRAHGRDDVYGIGDAAAVPDLTAKLTDTGSHPPCPPTAQHAMRQGVAVARNVIADIRARPRQDYRHRDLGLVVDLGGPQAVARPLGLLLHGPAAKVVTRGYHLYALPTAKRRAGVLLDWTTAGRTPNDVSFGGPQESSVLAKNEHSG